MHTTMTSGYRVKRLQVYGIPLMDTGISCMQTSQNNARYFSNRECEYYPCHKGADTEHFNCLFCYCPLYALKDKCGGNFRYTDKGIKDCTNCLLPHSEGGYEHVMAHIRQVLALSEQKKED